MVLITEKGVLALIRGGDAMALTTEDERDRVLQLGLVEGLSLAKVD